MLNTCSHRIASSLKLYNCHKYTINNLKLLTALNPHKTQINNVKYICIQPTKYAVKTSDEGIFRRILRKIPALDISKNKLKVSGYLLYELVADTVNYDEFFKTYSLPDTFYSWFVITEIHVWMLCVRTMAEGDDGRFTRNAIIQSMWSDVSTRAKKLGAANPAGVRMQIGELSEQFNAALIAYDEGLLSSDAVLSGALWRRFFQYQCDNPMLLESLVLYIRKQIKMLDHLSRDELLVKRQLKWLPLQSR